MRVSSASQCEENGAWSAWNITDLRILVNSSRNLVDDGALNFNSGANVDDGTYSNVVDTVQLILVPL